VTTNIPNVELAIQVKTYDVDLAQIVHNAVYIRWLEDLRTAIMDKYYPLDKWMALHLMPVLLETHIYYRRAVKLFDPVIGAMQMPRFGPVKWELDAQFRVNGELHIEARQVGCFIDMRTQRAAPVPKEIRTAFGS
jgi:acyl-CoA thioester hydrolase